MFTSAALGAAGEFAATHHGVIPRHLAAELGITAAALRSLVLRGVLRGPQHGCYIVRGTADVWQQRAVAVVLGRHQRAAASHHSARMLHEMEGRPVAPVHLLVAHGGAAVLSGVVVHQTRNLAVSDVVVVQGIPCTNLADMACQHELRGADGRVVARFDLAVARLRLAIEAHSRAHHVGDAVERADEARDLAVAALGWEAVSLGFAATRTPDDVRTQIERIAARRALDLRLPVLP